jgi:hypothetical protein
MDHRYPGSRNVRFDECRERCRVFVGVDAAGSCINIGHGSPANLCEQLRHMCRRFFAADVLDVGTADDFVGDRLAVLEAYAPRLGAADVQADDYSFGRNGVDRRKGARGRSGFRRRSRAA